MVKLILVGFSETEGPCEDPVAVRLTLPVKPLLLSTRIVVLPDRWDITIRGEGLAPNPKYGMEGSDAVM